MSSTEITIDFEFLERSPDPLSKCVVKKKGTILTGRHKLYAVQKNINNDFGKGNKYMSYQGIHTTVQVVG